MILIYAHDADDRAPYITTMSHAGKPHHLGNHQPEDEHKRDENKDTT